MSLPIGECFETIQISNVSVVEEFGECKEIPHSGKVACMQASKKWTF